MSTAKKRIERAERDRQGGSLLGVPDDSQELIPLREGSW